jgi:acyl-coenzyme A thioesterase PaaI-like protein
MKRQAFNARSMRRLLNFWPPFWFNGIKVVALSDDYRYAQVRLTDRFWRRNINGSQFGGSLFAMTDPIYPLMLMGALGKAYVVWDKKADIDFIRPGHGVLTAEFWLSDDVIQEIKEKTAHGDKCFPEFLVIVKDQQGHVVCELNRTIYVRKKKQYRPEGLPAPTSVSQPDSVSQVDAANTTQGKP